MALPLTLPNGYILIYGWGTARDGSEGLITPDSNKFVFGSVYQVWDGGAPFIYSNDNIMWKDGSEFCRLTYLGNPYTFIEARLVTKQDLIL